MMLSTSSTASTFSLHSATNSPSGWARASGFAKSDRFGEEGSASPGPGAHEPFSKSTLEKRSNSKTRPSYLSRRARYTAPLPMSRAISSLNGADQLLLPPGPDPGTYSGAASSSFKEALQKGKGTSNFKSNCSRFVPTITEEASEVSCFGAPEVNRPIKCNATMPIQWLKHVKRKRNVRQGSIRLGSHTDGECSGHVVFPANGKWRITFQIKCGEVITADSWSTHDQNDTVEVIVNDKKVSVVRNIPQGYLNPKSGMKDNGTATVSTIVDGEGFDFDFRFKSSSKRFLSHQMVMDGTAICVAIAPGGSTHARKQTRKIARANVSQPTTIQRRQYNKNQHPWLVNSVEDQNKPELKASLSSPSQIGSNCSLKSRSSVLRTSASNLMTAQPSWKEKMMVAERRRGEEKLVQELDNFVEPKTRNIRFY